MAKAEQLNADALKSAELAKTHSSEAKETAMNRVVELERELEAQDATATAKLAVANQQIVDAQNTLKAEKARWATVLEQRLDTTREEMTAGLNEERYYKSAKAFFPETKKYIDAYFYTIDIYT